MTISAAYRLACASADPAHAILDTVEMYHADWPSIVRLVADRSNLIATLEAGAPNNPSAAVTFTAFPLSLTVPRTGDGSQDVTLTISNASRMLMTNIAIAELNATAPINFIWRPYVTSDLTQPGLALYLAVKGITYGIDAVQLTCGLMEFANRKFPRPATGIYKVSEFPALAERN